MLLFFFPGVGRRERRGIKILSRRREKVVLRAEAGKVEGYFKVGWLNPKHPTGVSVQGKAKGSIRRSHEGQRQNKRDGIFRGPG